jgi:predicted acetyltransferase
MDLSFRPAKEEDLDRLVDIHLAAYPDARNVDERKRNFTTNPFGSLSDLVVAEHGRTVVAHGFLFPLEAFFGGASVRVSGIASVAVAPEARCRGVGTALMKHLHVASDVRGDAVTMLYAFRHRFYAALGYAVVASRKRLCFDARSIPDAWRSRAMGHVRAARGDDRDGIRRAHLQAAARASGWIARPESLWQRLFARERRFVLVCESGADIGGYVAFTLSQKEPHAETTLEIAELVAGDDATRRSLFGALAAMRDQVSEIVVELDARDPLEHVLVDPDGRRFGNAGVEHSLGEIVGGPMIRIEDVPRAIEARGYAAPGTFDVVIRPSADDPTDEIAVSVRVEEGRAEVGPAQGGAAIRTTRAGLAAIFYGGLTVADAVKLGLADAEERTAARIDAIAAIAPPSPIDAV